MPSQPHAHDDPHHHHPDSGLHPPPLNRHRRTPPEAPAEEEGASDSRSVRAAKRHEPDAAVLAALQQQQEQQPHADTADPPALPQPLTFSYPQLPADFLLNLSDGGGGSGAGSGGGSGGGSRGQLIWPLGGMFPVDPAFAALGQRMSELGAMLPPPLDPLDPHAAGVLAFAHLQPAARASSSGFGSGGGSLPPSARTTAGQLMLGVQDGGGGSVLQLDPAGRLVVPVLEVAPGARAGPPSHS